jgi:hypothetical protein
MKILIEFVLPDCAGGMIKLISVLGFRSCISVKVLCIQSVKLGRRNMIIKVGCFYFVNGGSSLFDHVLIN